MSKGKKELETNLVHQSGNGILESLGDVDQASDIMSTVEIHSTLGADSSLVSLAVRVNLKLGVFLAMKNSGSRRGRSSLQGLVDGDELVL